MIASITVDSEHEARQLAARYFSQRPVHILARTFRGQECYCLNFSAAPPELVGHDALLFHGIGGDAATIDQPLAWSATPVWKRGLWIRRAVLIDNTTQTQVLEWDGLGATPDVELRAEGELEIAWLGPLPPLPF